MRRKIIIGSGKKNSFAKGRLSLRFSTSLNVAGI